MKGLIGKKVLMHQMYTEDGIQIPVTIIEAQPNIVTQVKTADTRDKYQALQLATGFKREKLIKKPVRVHLAKADAKNNYYIKEFRDMSGFQLKDKVDLSIFNVGDFVDITSTSKGKGTAGVIKRHHFRRGPMTHGSKHHRAPGSVGISRADKVWKGQPLPGRKGNQRTTVQNIEIIKIDLEKNLLIVKGSIPGSNNTFCRVVNALKKTKVKTPVQLWTAPKEVVLEPKKVSKKAKKAVEGKKTNE